MARFLARRLLFSLILIVITSSAALLIARLAPAKPRRHPFVTRDRSIR